MTGDNHPSLRQARTWFQPSSLKQLDHHPSVHRSHARCRWMSQHAASIWGCCKS